jgi:DNA helicase-2/ATP-dependent DNA helicase PcrA
MTPKIELSCEQEKVVRASDGPIYVKASAGSGKTRVLTERIRQQLEITNKRLLALTFTNKAGVEIKDRLSDIPDVDKRIFVGTFHGFCQSVLESHGSLIGLATMPHIFEDESDRLELVEEAITQTPSYEISYRQKSVKEQKNFKYRVLEYISKVKRELIDDGNELGLHTDDENIVLLYQNYQDILRAQNAIDFDDLLIKANTLFVDMPKIAALYRRSYAAICIDEAQDLNNAQYQLLLSLTGHDFNNVMMVGDSNQSIYHFNGSSPKYMDEYFVRDFSPHIIELNGNYRSSKSVLRAAKMITPDSEDASTTVKEGVFDIQAQDDEHSEALWVANKIKELISLRQHPDIEGEICFEKIAVLARNKYVFKPLEERLIQESLPYCYKMTSGALRFESGLMKVFDLSLRLKLNPLDSLHKRRLLNSLGLNLDVRVGLDEICDNLPESNEKNLVKTVMALKEDGSNLKKNLEDYRDAVTIKDENERRMIFNDIAELFIHWKNYAVSTDNKSLHQFKNAMALGQTHPLTEHHGITLSTVHTMKGQEFDIVFVIGLDDETFPDYRAVRNGGIELTQEKNNLYVAFTRAKRFLYLTYPQKRMMPWGDFRGRSYSRFLQVFC